MVKHSFVVPMLLVTLICSMSHSQSEPNEAFWPRRPVFTPSTHADTSAWLTGPGLAAVLTESNEHSVNQEALFATYSFSNRGTTYNVEFYYREFHHRLRARVLVGDRELRGLFNRFYDVDPNYRYMLSVYGREEGKPELRFNFGRFTIRESAINTDAIYDAVEKFAAKSLPKAQSLWIRVYPPAGMLRKTCAVGMDRFRLLVNEKGQTGPFTLENLLIAYCQENIEAKEPGDFERIGRSLVNTLGESMGLRNMVVADANEVRRYSPRLLDSVDAAEIGPPSLYKDADSQTAYWTCYTCARYKMGPGILTRYRFGFQNGLLRSGERAVLGEDASGAYNGYANLKNVRVQEEIILSQSGEFNADDGFVKSMNLISERTVGTSPLLSLAMLRLVFVGAGVFLLILALVVRTYVRSRSQASTRAAGAEPPVCGTQTEEAANENE